MVGGERGGKKVGGGVGGGPWLYSNHRCDLHIFGVSQLKGVSNRLPSVESRKLPVQVQKNLLENTARHQS